jgi:WD40 repeat protein/tRNA A-37 threonylcarbamoyl transferase component Bud32
MKERLSSLASDGVCPGCGKPLKRGDSDGLCAACLLGKAMVLASEAEDSDTDAELIAASGLEGQKLGSYEIISTLAQGGMGVVFRARQEKPRRVVALKVISAGELATRRMIERFHNEAGAAARLNHPNIVPIYEVGEDRGWHYFSMRLVEGGTLADLIRDARPSPTAAVALLVKIARAVEHAHQRGILHRDLKPTNILLDEQNEPHLTDFGLAKIAEQECDLTLSHAVLGTPAYMSPEQATGRSRDITTATDVYGLGAVFYELLSGKPPFRAESTPALLRKIAEEDPARLRSYAANELGSSKEQPEGAPLASAVSTSVVHDLEAICLKCLEKNPAKRYPTAGELADELERWQRHEPIHARSATGWERALKWARRNRARAALFATVALSGFVLTVVSLFFNIRLGRARQAAEASAAASRLQLLHNHLSQASRFIESDDAFAGALWAATALQATALQEAVSQRARDRLQLVFQFSPCLVRVRALTEEPSRLVFTADGNSLRLENATSGNWIWSLADDTATSEPHEQFAVGAPAALTLVPTSGEAGERALTSPDGTMIATAGTDYSVQLRRATDGRLLAPLLHHGARVSAWAFSPDGRFFATASADLVARVWDLASSATKPFRFTLPVTRPPFSPDGNRFVAASAATEFRVCDAVSGEPVSGALDAGGKVASATFAKSGRHFATATDQGLIRVWEFNSPAYLAELQAEGPLLSLEFSPDGSTIGAANNPGRAWRWRWSDPSVPAREFTADALARRIEWSPDGKLFLIAGHRGVRLWSTADVQPVGEPILPAMYGFTARFNSAGTLLVASFQQKDRQPSFAQVYSVPKLEPVGPPISHGDAVRDVRFTADGSQVVTAGADAAIRVRHPGTGQPILPAMHHTGPVNNTGFSADQRWLVSCGSGDVRIWEMASGQLLAPTLHLPVEIYEAALSRSNRSLVLRGERDFSWFIPLNLSRFSDQDLADLAVLTAGYAPDAVGGLNALPADELQQSYRELRERLPWYFTWPQDSAIWHQQQAAFSRYRQDWHGTVFHLERLAQLHATNSATAVQLEEARAKLRE